MSSIKICDRCGNFFAERTHGSSCITSGVVYGDPDRNLAGDMCPDCTSGFLDKPKMVQGRAYATGELSDKETETGQWEPQ